LTDNSSSTSDASLPLAHLGSSELSKRNLELLEHARGVAGGLMPLDLADLGLDGELGTWKHRFQPLPLLADPAAVARMERATVELTRLVRSVPERVFSGDADRMARFYNLPDVNLVSLMLAEPSGRAESLARLDFIWAEEGLRCLEVNHSAYLGGWEGGAFSQALRTHGRLATYLSQPGLELRYHDPVVALFEHMIRCVLEREGRNAGEVNLCLVLAAEQARSHYAFERLRERFESLVRSHGLSGTLMYRFSHDDLRATDGGTWALSGERVHAIVEYTDLRTPGALYRCFKAGNVSLFNGPLGWILDDKRNLALLSELADGPSFAPWEREIIHDHVPWSRVVSRRKVQFEDESHDLLELILARRSDMVLKRGFDAGGNGVFVGVQHTPEAWKVQLDLALSEGGWMVQQQVRSLPFLLQQGADGLAPQSIVWGFFCMGESFGGGFLRMKPQGRDVEVINTARGAREGIFLEVVDPG
jgi:hypothetical protein